MQRPGWQPRSPDNPPFLLVVVLVLVLGFSGFVDYDYGDDDEDDRSPKLFRQVLRELCGGPL